MILARRLNAIVERYRRENRDRHAAKKPDGDNGAELWEMLREGKQRIPQKYDEDLIRDVASGLAGRKSAPEPAADDDFVPGWDDWMHEEEEDDFGGKVAGVPFSRLGQRLDRMIYQRARGRNGDHVRR